jgi:hypothetical protein
MIARSLQDTAIVEHYRELCRDDGSSMVPLLRLVGALSGKDYAPDLGAGTSHDALVISAMGTDDLVSVEYWPRLRVFQVRYWNARGKAETHRCEESQVERLVDALALRLLITRDTHAVRRDHLPGAAGAPGLQPDADSG